MYASNFAALHAFRNGDVCLSQMGVCQYSRVRVGSVHWQTAMEVVIRPVFPGTVIGFDISHPQPYRIKRHFQI